MKKVLIVDDSQIETDILHIMLQDTYEPRPADNGEKAIREAREFVPDLILMDVDMPEINGYMACRTMRDEGCIAPIIFLSSLNETGDKLKAYEAGADDFIGKPYDIKEMAQKIARNIERHDERLQARENQKQAMVMANRSMVDLSYLGRIINFTQKITTCRSYDELAQKTFALLNEMQLRSSLLIHSVEVEEKVYFCDGIDRPVEKAMLLSLKNGRRIFEFSKNRCAYNWMRASLLVKNMPEDEIEAGAMKDYLGYVMNAVEDAINALLVQSKLRQTIHNYKENNKALKLSIMAVIEDFEEHLESLFARPDVAQSLPVDVEDLVVNFARESTLKADNIFATGFNMETELDNVLEMFHPAQHEQEEQPPEDDDDAITLF
jgi:DNA-binding response OmpR family regulator